MTERTRSLRDKLVILLIGTAMSVCAGVVSGWMASQVRMENLSTRVQALEQRQERIVALCDSKLDKTTHDALQSQTDQRLAAIQQQQQTMQAQLAQIYALMLENQGGRP